jgi:acetyl esterase/lipase
MDFKKVYRMLIMCTAFVSAGMVSAFAAEQPVMLDVKVERPIVEMISGVVYSQPTSYNYKNYPLRMDVLKPASKEPLPAVVFVPGGGLISANKDKMPQERMDIAEAGYVVASIEYRVTPQNQFPDPIVDVKSAVRFLRANAKKFGIDPNRIAVMGNSAGGYMVAMTGATNGVAEFDKGDYLEQSSNVSAVIDLYGLSDLTKIGVGYPKDVEDTHYVDAAPEALFVNGIAANAPPGKAGGSILSNPEKAEKANPIHYINKDTPPFLIMVGSKDIRVSPIQSELLNAALVNKGADSTFYMVKDAGHGGAKWNEKQITRIMIDFLNKNLKY